MDYLGEDTDYILLQEHLSSISDFNDQDNDEQPKQIETPPIINWNNEDVPIAPKGYKKDGTPRKRLPKKQTPEHIKRTYKYKMRRERNTEQARKLRQKKREELKAIREKTIKDKEEEIICPTCKKIKRKLRCVYIDENIKLKRNIKVLRKKLSNLVSMYNSAKKS